MGFAFTFGAGKAQQTGNSASMRALAQAGMEERRMKQRQQEVAFNQDLATQQMGLKTEAQDVETRLREQKILGAKLDQSLTKQEAMDAWQSKQARSAINLGLLVQQEEMAPLTPEMEALAGSTKAIAARFPEGSSARADVYQAGAEQLGQLRVQQHVAATAGRAEASIRDMQMGMAEDGMDENETAIIKRLGEGLADAKQSGDIESIKAIRAEVFNTQQAIAKDRAKAGSRLAATGLIGAQIDTFLQSQATTNTMAIQKGAWMRANAARGVAERHKMGMYDDDFIALQEVDDALYGRDKGRNLEDPLEMMSQQATDQLTGRSGQADQMLQGFRQQAESGEFDPTQAAAEVDALPVPEAEKERIFQAMLNDPAIKAAKKAADQKPKRGWGAGWQDREPGLID